MNLIELKNINAYLGKNKVLKHINLTLPLGISHAILGPNGAGKSSLLKLMTRELYPLVENGSYIKVLGQTNVNIWQLRKIIGFVSNDLQANHGSAATGLEVILSGFFGSIGIHTHHAVTPDMRRSALAMLEELEIGELKQERYINLSTGQQRRLLLGRSLIHKPKALILDEPTAGLDLQAKFWFLKKIRELCDQGTTIIIVTHDTSEIVPEVTHVTMLKEGQVFKSGAKKIVLTTEILSELYGMKTNVFFNDGFYYVGPA